MLLSWFLVLQCKAGWYSIFITIDVRTCTIYWSVQSSHHEANYGFKVLKLDAIEWSRVRLLLRSSDRL